MPILRKLQSLSEAKPAHDIPSIIKREIRKSGFSPDALCSGGRCYEFRDQLHNALTRAGHKPHKTDATSWTRYDADKFDKPVGWAESGALENNHHAWIYHNGKHYDALNPEGSDSPAKMKFYQPSVDRFRPDDEEQYYRAKHHRQVYEPTKDAFVKDAKAAKQHIASFKA